MKDLTIKSAKLVAVPAKNTTLIASVVLPLPEKKGSVFGLVKVLGNASAERKRLVEIVLEHLERLQESSSEQINVPRRFEQVLQAMNENIAEHIAESPKIPLSDFHSIVGVQTKQQLFLSGVGSLSALFMHRTAKQRYVIYELDKQLQEDQSWQKPFLTVLDGELHPGDIFYLATRLSGRELSHADLQDVLVTLPPAGALKRIQQHLKRDSAFGGLCLQVSDVEKKGRPKKVNPLSSMEAINKTKDDTANLLGEQSPDIGSAVTSFLAPLMKKLSSPGTKGPKTIFKRLLKAAIQATVAIGVFIATFVKRLTAFTAQTVRQIRQRKQSSENGITMKTEEQKNESKQSIFDRLKKLPPISKYVAAGAGVIVLILIVTISLTGSNKGKQEQSEANALVIERIEEKKNAAEASLIYDDQEQARTHLTEAISLLESLPNDDKELEAEITRLTEELNELLVTIRGAKEVETKTLATLEGAQGSIVNAIEINGTIYVITAQNELASFTDLNQSFNLVNQTVGSVSTVVSSAQEDTDVLFVDANKNLGRTNLTNNTMNPITSGTTGLESVEAIATYNTNLYALTSAGEQIIKMQPQAAGYDGGTIWITSKTSDLSTATSLAIDGDIYVLTKTTIVKFTSGREQTVAFDVAEPALSDAAQLWTSVDTDYLYVLEPAAGRVLVYEKTGKLVSQYLSSQFNNATGMIVREEQNTVYITTTDTLLSFDAEHLLQ